MTWKALEWHGLAGTEWRMQVGGERLGRVGIAVAGMEKLVKARGMEGSGTVGIMEAWQAWSGCSGRDCSGLTGSGWLRHGRYGGVRYGGGRCEMARFGRRGAFWSGVDWKARERRRGASRQRGER